MSKKIKKTNVMYLVLGDWSNDGHNMSDKIKIAANKTHIEIQNAYLKSVKLTGIGFDHNNVKDDQLQIATNYQDTTISDKCLKILNKFNCPIDEFLESSESNYYVIPDQFTNFWFWFVSLSLPDLKWEEVKDEIPNINGFWNKNLNVQFAYGIYNG